MNSIQLNILHNKILFIFSFLLLLQSCSEKDMSKNLLPDVTGKAGEILLIIDDRYKSTEAGTAIQNVLMAEHVGLPQPEPLFDLIPIPKSGFKNLLQKYRNIIQVDINPNVEESQIKLRRDLWASTQLFISLEAPSEAEMVTLFEENKFKIIKFLIKGERDRLQANYESIRKQNISKQLRDSHQLDLIIPSGYLLDVNRNDFVWIEQNRNKGKHEVKQGIFIYHYPYLDTTQLLIDSLIATRNSFLKKNVPGPSEGSYMGTETRIPATYNSGNMLNENYAIEIRGLWKTEGDFMGGPFISLTTIDTLRNRVITAEGFVYAPKFDKRNYLREVEAIIRTLEFSKIE